MFEKAKRGATLFAAAVLLLLVLQTVALGAILAELKDIRGLVLSGLPQFETFE